MKISHLSFPYLKPKYNRHFYRQNRVPDPYRWPKWWYFVQKTHYDPWACLTLTLWCPSDHYHEVACLCPPDGRLLFLRGKQRSRNEMLLLMFCFLMRSELIVKLIERLLYFWICFLNDFLVIMEQYASMTFILWVRDLFFLRNSQTWGTRTI